MTTRMEQLIADVEAKAAAFEADPKKGLAAGKAKLGVSPAQCRGARAMLGISQSDLAAAAQISRQTIVEFERGARPVRPASLAALQTALEAAGVTFTHGREPGVRMRKVEG